jgi:hypothetical protein
MRDRLDLAAVSPADDSLVTVGWEAGWGRELSERVGGKKNVNTVTAMPPEIGLKLFCHDGRVKGGRCNSMKYLRDP